MKRETKLEGKVAALRVRTVSGTIKEQIADEITDQVVNETFEPQDFVPKHVWETFYNPDYAVCKMCGANRTNKNGHEACPDAIAERAISQLKTCLLAAEGQPTDEQVATRGDYTWSSAYEVTRKLWDASKRLADTLQEVRTNNKRLLEAMLKSNLLTKIGDLMMQLKKLREENEELRKSMWR